MRKITLIFSVLAVAVIALAAQNVAAATPSEQPQGAHFKFDEMTHDFGTVAHSLSGITHRFEFTNDGTEPLVITKTATSCTCTKVSYIKKPVPPGGRGWIEVLYEVNKKEPGVFYKAVEIYSNSVDKRISLVVKGNAKK